MGNTGTTGDAPSLRRVIILVMDSVGIGELPDADRFGDRGANTLGHIAEACDGLELPSLAALGLGNIAPLHGMPPAARPEGAFGKCAELSPGKDTATGHWELAGLRLDAAFPTFPHGFPEEILAPFRQRTGRGVLGNEVASGTEILDRLGPAHMASGDLIVYTSADSVFQIAAHEEVVPLAELYRACEIAREILAPYNVGRVIARPFVGPPGAFRRTYNRRDYALPPPGPTVLDHLAASGRPVVGIGKIGDIYAHRGVTEEVHSEGNRDGMELTLAAMDRIDEGLIMVNLVDFDSLYGHRRNVTGYYQCLREFDAQLATLRQAIQPGDLVLITADHGNDPTMPGTDHTREYVPLLAFGPPGARGVDLGTRQSFADVGATVAEIFALPPPRWGQSFLAALR
jgi:phosphopentomutase